MNNTLKQATISALLCSFIILLSMDLSYLKTYFTKVATAMEKRKDNNLYEEQRYATTLPNEYIIFVKDVVYSNAFTYVSGVKSTKSVVNNLSTPTGVSCRGSPSIRSP